MADIKIQPLGNRVLVKPQEEEETIAGGLVVPPSANDDKRPAMGKVLKLGIGKDEDGNKLSIQGSGAAGQAIRKVPFFTNSGGLTTPNKRFEFNATIETRTAYGDANHTFTKSNGSSGLASADITLFQF